MRLPGCGGPNSTRDLPRPGQERGGEADHLLYLGRKGKGMGVGELHVRLPSIYDFPEFRARVIIERNLWVMLPSGEYRKVP